MELIVIVMMIAVPVLMLGVIALWFYSLFDVIRSDFEPNSEKIVWLLIVLFLNGLGAILYWLIGRKKRLKR